MCAARKVVMLRLSLAAAVVSVAIFAGTAAADISRGCSGVILVHAGGNQTAVAATIEGRAYCSRWHPNQCRERARNAITNCVNELWAQRTQNALPPSCIISGGGRPWAKLTWSSSGINNQRNRLLSRVGWKACCELRPTVESTGFFLRIGINGDNGCHRAFTLDDNYQFACRVLRNVGFCS
jgi:hypothetical protein